ncbi:MAG: Type secretory pathway VirD4 component-like protein [Holophagaceae bacterium]|nr:Type secretory pathway VirD4 component-like protein [Holophagaceae bacterium]
MSLQGILRLLATWQVVGWLLVLLGVWGAGAYLVRWQVIRRTDPRLWLAQAHAPWTRWVLARSHPGMLPLCGVFVGSGFLLESVSQGLSFRLWIADDPRRLPWLSVGLLVAAMVGWMLWDRHPRHLKRGAGRPEAEFRDLPEDFGRWDVVDGKKVGGGRPTCVLLAYRDRSKVARRVLRSGQRRPLNLGLLSLRWDVMSRHLLLLGMQGSGKTTTVYGHMMISLEVPWIYQDSKAELPLRDRFPDLPVWGLDVRGHETRSGILNFMAEIRTAEDFDLITNYVFPINPRDANPWVRELSRVLFGAILRARPWPSIQEISRELRRTRLDPFLDLLDPIWRDLLSEPKSQVPVMQDLVATLARWEAPRVAAITEGGSTVTLDDFLAQGGWVMNCEDSDALRAPVHLFWAMALGRLRNRPEGASRIVLLLDEFGDAGRMPNIVRSLILLRSKGVSFVAGLQTLGLLKDTYGDQWQAVAQSFGTKIWLCRNAEEESRELLTRVLGRWIRVTKGHPPHTKETESPVDLVPVDAWGRWSDERAAIARSNGYTYWLPLSLDIPRTPLGDPVAARDPWEEAESLAAKALEEVATPGDEELMSIPEEGAETEPMPSGLESLSRVELGIPPAQPSQPSHSSRSTTPGAGNPPLSEEDWL